jgi:hypothetical protein
MKIIPDKLTYSGIVVSEEVEITERSPRATRQVSGISLTLQPMGLVHLNAHTDYFIYTNSRARSNPEGIPFEPEIRQNKKQ